MHIEQLILAAAAAALGGLVPFSAGFAADGETKTLTDNYYQQSVVNYECRQYGCTVIFPATTAAITEITNVSCSVVLPTGTQIQSAALVSNDGYGPSLAVVPQVVGAGSNVFTVVLNASGNCFTPSAASDVRSWVLYGGRLLLHVHRLHDHRISLVEAQSISDCGKAAKGGACGCPLLFWYAAVPHCRTRNGHPLTLSKGILSPVQSSCSRLNHGLS